MLPGRHAINAGLLAGALGCGGALIAMPEAPGLPLLSAAAVFSGIQGLTLTAAIGGKCLIVLMLLKHFLKILQ